MIKKLKQNSNFKIQNSSGTDIFTIDEATGNLNVTGTITNTAITQLQEELENKLDVIDIADEDVNKSFYELGIGDKVLSGRCIIRGVVDDEDMEYIPINISDDYTTYFRIRYFNATDKYIVGYYYNVEADDISLTDMYSEEDTFQVPKVVANPELEGTESALTGLRVGDTKYKIPVETKLYRHSLGFRYDDEPFKDIEFDITSTTSTPATNLNTAINVLENAISTVFNGTEEGVGLDVMGYFYVSNDIIINYIKTDPGAFPFESVVVDNDTYWTIGDIVTEL